MSGVRYLAIVGRSLQDLTGVWGQLHPFFRNGDLIVDADPVRRALDAATRPGCCVVVIADGVEDCAAICRSSAACEALIVLCKQGSCDGCPPAGGIAILPLEDAFLVLMGTEALTRDPILNRRGGEPS